MTGLDLDILFFKLFFRAINSKNQILNQVFKNALSSANRIRSYQKQKQEKKTQNYINIKYITRYRYVTICIDFTIYIKVLSDELYNHSIKTAITLEGAPCCDAAGIEIQRGEERGLLGVSTPGFYDKPTQQSELLRVVCF